VIAEPLQRCTPPLPGFPEFLNPMGTKLCLSLAHDQAVCDAFLERYNLVLGEVA
jgi:hypothetical protein